MLTALEEPRLDEPCGSTHRVSGTGRVELAHVNGRTAITRAAASSPLKLLAPAAHSGAAWVFTSTYGGGLVGGDVISMNLKSGEQTRALLSTQSSTKVYRTVGPTCRQELNASIGDGALVVCAPDPVVCYAGAKYEQRQRFRLKASAGLVMIDWITSGRRARGERWAFSRYLSHSEVYVEDRCVFRDAILLDPADGALDGPMRMGRCDCFATILLIGQSLAGFAEELSRSISSMPMRDSNSVLLVASPVPFGVFIRAAASETESIANWIRRNLGFVGELLGDDPWCRKW